MRVQVFYSRGASDKWTNVYHLFAPSVGDAADAADVAMTAPLLSLLDQTCQLDKFLVSDTTSAAYTEVPKQLAGTGTGGGSLIPLFNSIKVRYPTAAAGRPDYKFYKGFITEDLQSAGLLNSGTVTTIQGILQSMLGNLVIEGAPACSESGDAWGNPVVQQAIQMRQMHRRRRRVITSPDP